jgi:uncharacterized membrane protein YfcA
MERGASWLAEQYTPGRFSDRGLRVSRRGGVRQSQVSGLSASAYGNLVDATMSALEFAGLIFLGSSLAGFLGSLTGLGGGVVVTPLLTLAFGVDIRYAIGATLVSVIATSSGAASAYVKEGFSNIRIGMFLEVATTFGAITGALLATRMPAAALAVIFGVVLAYSGLSSAWSHKGERAEAPPDPLATRLKMNGSYPTPDGPRPYHVCRVPAGFSLMYVAGVLSGLLGIGSGAVKVLALDQAMRIPFKVSTTTSNFMIGVTAAASAGVYLNRGYIDPCLAMPVMLGVLTGAMAGTRVLMRAKVRMLRWVFACLVLALAVEMIRGGLIGKL